VLRKTEQDMEEFATAGLRTLVVAVADISADKFEQWNRAYGDALGDVAEQVTRLNCFYLN
jgi:magnesium-transporting ATPase (P-type)